MIKNKFFHKANNNPTLIEVTIFLQYMNTFYGPRTKYIERFFCRSINYIFKRSIQMKNKTQQNTLEMIKNNNYTNKCIQKFSTNKNGTF